MEIKSYKTYMLRNADFLALMKNISVFGNEEDTTALKIVDELLALDHAISILEPIVNVVRSSSETDKLALLSSGRDKVLILFYTCADKFQDYPVDKDILTAAHELKRILDSLPRLNRLSYTECTTDTNSFISEVSAPSFIPFIQTLGLESWLNELKRVNDEFSTCYEQRIESKVEHLVPEGGAQDARDNTQLCFENLCKRINALALIDGDTPYTSLINKINIAVKDAQDNAHRKGSKSNNSYDD